ncbi:expressed unknown protein [Seminavis robusta]|uniref:Uncharacterized protein n=1 Tax=Seminavis robusta TaxID=568900 RepID=A0A9N8DKC2_9STRA|nr:expressed unknown protein [Seminavis robusta]|eukprot:Sro176_g077210.1 n/a (342) ;mRNA; r:8431-9456
MTFRVLLSLLASSSAPTTKMNRQFQFVNYGASFDNPDESRPTISCDGRIPGGVSLELTHWAGNETPDELYADTSTEMAIKLALHEGYAREMKNAFVLNNHFDTDGLLSVWACLQPEQALEYSDLLIQGAEAGDFGEWSSDLGVKLDCALGEIHAQCKDDKEAFRKSLEVLPELLQDLKRTGGSSFESMWRPGLDYANKSWNNMQRRDTALVPVGEGIVMLQKPAFTSSISPYALHRGLVEMELDESVQRILHVNIEARSLKHFKYEKAGHGWVQKLVQRREVPGVDSNLLVETLNNKIYGDGLWKAGGGGLVSICHTTKGLSKTAEKVAEHLARFDDGLQG